MLSSSIVNYSGCTSSSNLSLSRYIKYSILCSWNMYSSYSTSKFVTWTRFCSVSRYTSPFFILSYLITWSCFSFTYSYIFLPICIFDLSYPTTLFCIIPSMNNKFNLFQPFQILRKILWKVLMIRILLVWSAYPSPSLCFGTSPFQFWISQ